jgi:hypothetical protein
LRASVDSLRKPAPGFLGCWVALSPVFIHNDLVFIRGSSKLSATDASARVPMKDAAKCDTHCELQNSVNQQISERILRSRVIPVGIPASALSRHYSTQFRRLGVGLCRCLCARAGACPAGACIAWVSAEGVKLCCPCGACLTP